MNGGDFLIDEQGDIIILIAHKEGQHEAKLPQVKSGMYLPANGYCKLHGKGLY